MGRMIAITLGGVLIIVGSAVFLGREQSPDIKIDEDSAAVVRTAGAHDVRMPPVPISPAEGNMTAVHTDGTDVKATKAVELNDICTGKSGDFFCYEAYYEAIIKKDGIAAAFTDLKSRSTVDAFVLAQCHPLTHIIGRTAAEMYTSVSEAYAHGDGFCWSGYYHGVLETFVSKVGLENIRTQIASVCSPLNADGKYDFNYFNCVHGLGHGLMTITDDHLFDSLKLCNSFAASWEQESCAGGVFMENVIIDHLGQKTEYLDPARPLYPCSESPENHKQACYLMQTSYMLKVNGGDFAKTFEWCRGAGTFDTFCFQGVGRDASGLSSSDAMQTKESCQTGANENEITNCVIGAVKDFISYFHSDTQAKTFCDLFGGSIRTICHDTVTSYYQSF